MSSDEDPTDIFDSSLSTIFSIAPVAFSTNSSDSYHTYLPPSGSAPIQLRLPQPPAELYTTLQAQNLWLSAIYLSDQLSNGHIAVKGKRVAELGAGAGLPGIIACRDGGAEVISSDWGVKEVLDVIRDNFQRACTGRWEVVGHKWGEDPIPLREALSDSGQKRFDALLLADVLWVTAAHTVLLDSIFSLLRPGGIAHITAGLHTGRGPVERFITSAKGRGGMIRLEAEVKWRSDGGWDPHTGGGSELEEERGVVVYFTLHIPP